MATLTLKNVPDHVVERLKEQAARHRRSLNQEAIARLEATVAVRSEAETDRIRRKLEASIERSLAKGIWVESELVDALIEEGRP